ncbi:MAG: hypothetical protein ACK4F6_04210 [Hylemonella sp.]|jgi:hypothetical protein
MLLSKPKSAEANFREAFDRLKAGVPKVLPKGTPVSQNNVSKEAGCDPTALRKSRFPALVTEIQAYIAGQGGERIPSERQRLLKQRQQSRNSRELITDLKAQRDAAESKLLDANAQIGILTRRLRDMEARLEDLRAKASIFPLPPTKPKAIPRVIV